MKLLSAFTVAAFAIILLTAAGAHAQMPPYGQEQGPNGAGPQEKPVTTPPQSAEKSDVPPPTPPVAETPKTEEALMLKNRRDEMLLHISDRLKEIEKEKSCVENAVSLEALHNCRPADAPATAPGDVMGGEKPGVIQGEAAPPGEGGTDQASKPDQGPGPQQH